MIIVAAGDIVWLCSTTGVGGRWQPAPEPGLVFPATKDRESWYVPSSSLRQHARALRALLKDAKP